MAAAHAAQGSRGLAAGTRHSSSARNIPSAIPKQPYLATAKLSTFNLNEALQDFRLDLTTQHKLRLTSVPPPVQEKPSPLGGGRRRGRSIQPLQAPTDSPARTRSTPPPRTDHDFLMMIMERNGRPVGPDPLKATCVPVPLRVSYDW
mmetsp:Transcript_28317/g.64127  ORF Transcript_28317/g.64127 Transcript_28317/m.64127 type:complete len:147 (-) Transcript_28317:83-523(-)|eukprot:CAMPEP_0197896306 /NCGR_PEP_ID=MMETSP1439-20131203/39567_1 /TAXON_ID=66791 /ORGANISM="Gonyaulax spinifera, Strain CCMP409" /LENGTH=146 /DNA_ID=CAMNT_0043516813 /DNA_START=43 /DNA_END=483 /DNA_ORIENTATION=-